MEKKTTSKLPMPPKKISITIGNNSYDIKFPNNGQLVQIEVEKLNMSSGLLKELLANFSSISSLDAYLVISAAATFQVLIPDLNKDLNIGSLLELDMFQSRTITSAYEEYHEWMKKCREFINQDIRKEEESEEESEAEKAD